MDQGDDPDRVCVHRVNEAVVSVRNDFSSARRRAQLASIWKRAKPVSGSAEPIIHAGGGIRIILRNMKPDILAVSERWRCPD